MWDFAGLDWKPARSNATCPSVSALAFEARAASCAVAGRPRAWRRTGSTDADTARESLYERGMLGIDPLLAFGVVIATAATDAVYVMFTSAVVARRRVPAATWSSIWYVLSSFAVISYTNNWIYVVFAAVGSWIGAYATMTFLHGPPSHPPAPLKPSPAGDPEAKG